MFRPRLTSLLTLLVCILLLSQISSAHVIRRQDDGSNDDSSSVTSSISDETTSTNKQPSKTSSSSTSKASVASTSVSVSATVTQSSATSTSNSTAASAAASIPSASYTGLLTTPTSVPADGLPINIKITPAFGIAGVFLIAAGGALAFWKNSWVQAFIANGLLGSLATTVLILYVTESPVKDGIQGAYFVAAFLTGITLGGLSTLFREITESLGCLLGGFCMSMWFLTLRSEGLIQGQVGIVIFIAAWSIVGWCMYWSRFTRDWSVMVCMAFSGATAMVIGIDCFSRAGMKEFWVYLWNINSDLFIDGIPFNLTKGMRVESAANVIFFLAGMVAQTRLWRTIKAKKEAQMAKEKAARADIEAQDEAAGRVIEAKVAKERQEWERTYGVATSIKDADDSVIARQNSEDSGVHGISPEQASVKATGAADDAFVVSHPEPTLESSPASVHEAAPSTPQRQASVASKRTQNSTSTPVTPLQRSSLMAHSANGQDASVMVRVSRDDTVLSPRMSQNLDSEEKAWVASEVVPATPSPEVVPLPFKVEEEEVEETASNANRSSVATFNDEDAGASHRASVVDTRRMSQSPRTFARSVSQRSSPAQAQKETEEMTQPTIEDIMKARATAEGDDMSVAATFDEAESRKSILVEEEVDEKEESDKASTVKEEKEAKTEKADSDKADEAAEETKADESKDGEDKSESTEDKTSDDTAIPEEVRSTSSRLSASVSLTKDVLPGAFSRTAMKYRTNEWVKHSTTAEVPEPEEIVIAPLEADNSSEEVAKPVDVEDLQLTAADVSIPTARISRSVSPANVPAIVTPAVEANPRHSFQGSIRSTNNARNSFQGSGRNSFQGSARNSLTREEPIDRSSSAMGYIDQFQRPPVPGVVSYDSPQTLLGQRDLYLRAKTQLTQLPGNMQRSVSDNMIAEDTAGDDIPLSQRRHLMRQSATASTLVASPGSPGPRRSAMGMQKRESRLASFRQSVQGDMAIATSHGNNSARHSLSSQHSPNTALPVATAAASGTTTTTLKPTSSLMQNAVLRYGREDDEHLQRQRSLLMSKKEAERTAREAQRREREMHERRYDQMMMTSGSFQDAHREALRKMQQQAK